MNVQRKFRSADHQLYSVDHDYLVMRRGQARREKNLLIVGGIILGALVLMALMMGGATLWCDAGKTAGDNRSAEKKYDLEKGNAELEKVLRETEEYLARTAPDMPKNATSKEMAKWTIEGLREVDRQFAHISEPGDDEIFDEATGLTVGEVRDLIREMKVRFPNAGN